MINESTLEREAMGWFQEAGWNVALGQDITHSDEGALRSGITETILKPVVLSALKRLNPHLPLTAIEEAFHTLTHPKTPDLLRNNLENHRLLIEGVPVRYKKDDGTEIHDRALLIDFNSPAHNHFLVVNQFKLKGTRQNRIPDMVCFINGLPVAVIELKNPADVQTTLEHAFNQIETYKAEISDLFLWNEACVISDGWLGHVGSLTASEERYLPWRTLTSEDDRPDAEFQLETVVKGFFNPALFLDYIRYFVLFEDDGKITKKIAAYHQFHAVRNAVQATITAQTQPSVLEDGSTTKKGGVIWHTQGSGKSISMCCFAGMLMAQPALNNPTLVIVTDRNDLDGQLYATFGSAEMLLRQKVEQATGRDELRYLLSKREAGGIIFTTVQKFSVLDGEGEHPILNNRPNIVVISDEAHRSQYGLKASLNRKTGEYQYGYAYYMRQALPHATFVGFTGTPISFEDKDTQAVFGDYVSIYDIQDAVADKATVPLYYESRLAQLSLNQDEIEELSAQVEELIEEEELERREKTKGEWTRLEKLVGATPRLKQVAADIVAHFDQRLQVQDGKAMIVTMSRDICVALYDEIIALRPEWHSDDPKQGAIKIIMTGSASDKEALRPHIYSKQVKKELEGRFKKAEDPLKIVIVRDMWLTGFDAPCCHTLYVDKPMKGHNLMQAIARVNRVFGDKQGGLVVDYIGIAGDLKAALKTYTDARGKGSPTLDAGEAFKILGDSLASIRGLFGKTTRTSGFDYSAFDTQPLSILRDAINYILDIKGDDDKNGVPEGKKRFLDLMATLTKAYSLCSTLPAVQPLKKEIAFFDAIKAGLMKLSTNFVGEREQKRQDSALKQILDNAVKSDGVMDVFSLCGLQKPNIGLLSDEFLEDVRKLPHRNLAVELLQKLLKDGIKAKGQRNLVQEKKYDDRLAQTLLRYHNRSIETAQVVEELIDLAKDFQSKMKRDEDLGLQSDEIAFYDALANNESAVRELGDDLLKKIAVEITQNLRKSVTVDWRSKETVRSRIRILVKRILKKYKYPPDQEIEAVELIMDQTEALSDMWTQ